jgi:hypothetical protein
MSNFVSKKRNDVFNELFRKLSEDDLNIINSDTLDYDTLVCVDDIIEGYSERKIKRKKKK